MCLEWGATVEGLNIDAGTKKSIWQKMQRKSVNTVLRPSQESIVKNLSSKKSSFKADCFDMGKGDATIDQALRAEELLLLSLHPEAPTDSIIRVEHEPGWHLRLDTHQQKNPNSILHVDRTGLVSQGFLSVCCSTGRQAASFIEPHHLRTLNTDAPLSFVTKACALAETNPSCRERATKGMRIIQYYSLLLFFIFLKLILRRSP
jgi:hypothetical protein